MVKSFSAYRHKWHWLLARPDANIDHRRVPNLMVFFSRKGESLPTSKRAEDYSPGDLVTYDLGGGIPHIAIVVDRKSLQPGATWSFITSDKARGSKTCFSIGK